MLRTENFSWTTIIKLFASQPEVYVLPEGVLELTDRKYLALKGLERATFCVRNQDSTTVPAKHMWETGYLN